MKYSKIQLTKESHPEYILKTPINQQKKENNSIFKRARPLTDTSPKYIYEWQISI